MAKPTLQISIYEIEKELFPVPLDINTFILEFLTFFYIESKIYIYLKATSIIKN